MPLQTERLWGANSCFVSLWRSPQGNLEEMLQSVEADERLVHWQNSRGIGKSISKKWIRWPGACSHTRKLLKNFSNSTFLDSSRSHLVDSCSSVKTLFGQAAMMGEDRSWEKDLQQRMKVWYSHQQDLSHLNIFENLWTSHCPRNRLAERNQNWKQTHRPSSPVKSPSRFRHFVLAGVLATFTGAQRSSAATHVSDRRQAAQVHFGFSEILHTYELCLIFDHSSYFNLKNKSTLTESSNSSNSMSLMSLKSGGPTIRASQPSSADGLRVLGIGGRRVPDWLNYLYLFVVFIHQGTAWLGLD